MNYTDYEKIEQSARRKQAAIKTVTYALLAVWALIVLFAIVLTITCINLLVSKKHVHYI